MKVAQRKGNPLRWPRVASKWYSIDELRLAIESCRACGEPFIVDKAALDAAIEGRYVMCRCGHGCFEVNIAVIHTIDDPSRLVGDDDDE